MRLEPPVCGTVMEHLLNNAMSVPTMHVCKSTTRCARPWLRLAKMNDATQVELQAFPSHKGHACSPRRGSPFSFSGSQPPCPPFPSTPLHAKRKADAGVSNISGSEPTCPPFPSGQGRYGGVMQCTEDMVSLRLPGRPPYSAQRHSPPPPANDLFHHTKPPGFIDYAVSNRKGTTSTFSSSAQPLAVFHINLKAVLPRACDCFSFLRTPLWLCCLPRVHRAPRPACSGSPRRRSAVARTFF